MNPVSFSPPSMRYNARLAQKPRFGQNDANSTEAAASLQNILKAEGYALHGLLASLSIFADKLLNPAQLSREETLKLAKSLEDSADVLKSQAEILRQIAEAPQAEKK